MEWIQLKNHTWMIPGATCVGVYLFEDGDCILIDSGFDERAARGILQLLEEHHVKVWGIINTHAHGDHTGGNQLLQEHFHCQIWARPQEALQINHPELQAGFLFGAEPLPILQVPFITPPVSTVTQLLNVGKLEIKGTVFEIVDLAGHSVEHCGVITPDGVSFLGDALIEAKALEAAPFVYSAYVERSVESIQRIEQLEADLFCLAHSGVIEDLSACVEKNKEVFQAMLAWYLHLLEEREYSREELLQLTLNQRVGKTNTLRYFLVQTTVSAYLAYLCREKVVRCHVKEGRLLFFLKGTAEEALKICRLDRIDEISGKEGGKTNGTSEN